MGVEASKIMENMYFQENTIEHDVLEGIGKPYKGIDAEKR